MGMINVPQLPYIILIHAGFLTVNQPCCVTRWTSHCDGKASRALRFSNWLREMHSSHGQQAVREPSQIPLPCVTAPPALGYKTVALHACRISPALLGPPIPEPYQWSICTWALTINEHTTIHVLVLMRQPGCSSHECPFVIESLWKAMMWMASCGVLYLLVFLSGSLAEFVIFATSPNCLCFCVRVPSTACVDVYRRWLKV